MYIYIFIYLLGLGDFFLHEISIELTSSESHGVAAKKKTFHLEELAMPAQPVSSVKLQPTSPKVGCS